MTILKNAKITRAFSYFFNSKIRLSIVQVINLQVATKLYTTYTKNLLREV